MVKKGGAPGRVLRVSFYKESIIAISRVNRDYKEYMRDENV